MLAMGAGARRTGHGLKASSQGAHGRHLPFAGYAGVHTLLLPRAVNRRRPADSLFKLPVPDAIFPFISAPRVDFPKEAIEIRQKSR